MNKTFIPASNYNKRKWYVIDCKDKQLGRLASTIIPLLTGKSKFHFTENNILNQQNIRNDFFNTRYYLDGNLTIIWNKIGIYFQTNFSKYSNLYKDLFNYSYGITLCI